MRKSTGCRRGKILGLYWDAIDRETHHLLCIDRVLLYTAGSGASEDTSKTGEMRCIKIPTETVQLLKLTACA